ncbi:hypothetical protein L208DRAFT_1268931 [Tricholoma matsutake]|nr:hypothetical protein L208DRAFT_1268931 [Tricholoma matsutake 945]
MPQSSSVRKDAITLQRAQDKESKRARGALSCAECRRLKLKCDKTVPCSSCKRRGCSAICPNGSLITGQGTRFVLADTEKLHQKIGQMSDRIRQLEDALAILQSTQTRDPHPLLHRDLLKIKSSIDLHSAAEGEDGLPNQEEDIEESQYIDAFGTLAIREDGAATFYGRSAGSESLLIGEASSPNSDRNTLDWPGSGPQTLPSPIAQLSNAFPLSSNIHATSFDSLQSHLPPWPNAWRLCELYLEQAPWFFGAVTKRQLHEELLPIFYTEALMSPPLPSNTTSAKPAPKAIAHELALLFVIFCFGALTDVALPSAPDNPEAEQFYQLTKAALTLEPVLERPPSVATVQALALMAIYEGLCSGENSIESTWALMGLATKLAQSVGCFSYRDCARWKLTPAEVQKRRVLFWELFIADCWQSLATGRLATFSLPFVDCELPFDPDQTMGDDESIHPSFPYWKARFGAECVSAVVQGTLTSRAPRYFIILELDRKVRDMELPAYAHGPVPQGVGLAQTMSHFMPTNYRELTLLYIHRCFFAHAISSHPLDPIKSQYAPSFLAGYRSACTIIESVKQQFSLFPAQIARFWVLWTNAFSSAVRGFSRVMLASVVTHSSQSKVAPAALLELRTAYELFESAAPYGGRAMKFFPIIQRLQTKARQVFLEANSGITPGIPNNIFQSTPPDKQPKDELSIFSGKTHPVATKAKSSTPPTRSRSGTSPHTQSSVPGSSTSSSSRSLPDSPQGLLTDYPSFAGVHPSLVDELNAFDGHIASQIRDAYLVNNGLFGAPMDISRERRHQHMEFERQQHQHMEREREREEIERQQQRHQMEMERQQHMERERLERQQLEIREIEMRQHQMQQQQRHQQQQQYQRQQEQQLEQQRQLHRRQEAQGSEQQQRQFRHPQDQQLQHYQHPPQNHAQYQQQYEQPPPGLRATLSHSRSFANIHQQHQQQQHQHQPIQPPHSMYVVPPEYRPQHRPHPESTSHSPQTTPFPISEPGHSYDANANPQQIVVDTDDDINTTGFQEYWAAAPTDYSNTGQVPATPQSQVYQHHYTPDAALKGIAADDRSLQETWQSYMYNVGSPRHLFQDQS